MPLHVDVNIKETYPGDDPTIPEGHVLLSCTAPGREPRYFCVPEHEFRAEGGQSFAECYVADSGGLPS